MTFKALALTILITSAGATQAATVKEVFNGAMPSTDQRDVESTAGVPRASFGNDPVFAVQGCRITATIGHGLPTERCH